MLLAGVTDVGSERRSALEMCRHILLIYFNRLLTKLISFQIVDILFTILFR